MEDRIGYVVTTECSLAFVTGQQRKLTPLTHTYFPIFPVEGRLRFLFRQLQRQL
jgi:hypothetical protein